MENNDKPKKNVKSKVIQVVIGLVLLNVLAAVVIFLGIQFGGWQIPFINA